MQFDALSQPYPSQRNAAWRAYVAARFPAVFARIASPRSEVSAASVPDPNFAAETTAPDHSRYSLIDSEAALVREQVLCCQLEFSQPLDHIVWGIQECV